MTSWTANDDGLDGIIPGQDLLSRVRTSVPDAWPGHLTSPQKAGNLVVILTRVSVP